MSVGWYNLKFDYVVFRVGCNNWFGEGAVATDIVLFCDAIDLVRDAPSAIRVVPVRRVGRPNPRRIRLGWPTVFPPRSASSPRPRLGVRGPSVSALPPGDPKS